MTLKDDGIGAVAAVTRRAADRLRAGHLWVYRSDLERLTSVITLVACTTGRSPVDRCRVRQGRIRFA